MTTEREAALEAQLDQLNTELVSRAKPRLAEMIDSVRNMVELARVGTPGAAQVLRDFTTAMDEARTVGSGIEIVKSANGGTYRGPLGGPHAV
jgi:hypothetical protein